MRLSEIGAAIFDLLNLDSTFRTIVVELKSTGCCTKAQ
jgi:hypothetical protein